MRFLLGYRHPSVKLYRPSINKKRQAGLFLLMAGDIILPLTFGIGIAITKLITKYKPLFLYQ